MPHVKPPPGAPCWFEVASTMPAASAGFHRDLFGWQTADLDLGPMGTYTFLRNANGTISALCGLPPGQTGPPAWNVYFGVVDVDASCTRARSLGADVLAAPFDVADHGRMATLRDPTGAAFNLWQSRNPRCRRLHDVRGSRRRLGGAGEP